MNHETFKHTFEAVLRDSRLPIMGVRPTESLDVLDLSRTYSVRVEPYGGQDAEPFVVTANLSWRWDAIETARSATSEEDFLVEVLGRETAEEIDSEHRRLRVDVKLSATLTWGHPLPMPSAKAWASWARETLSRLEDIERLIPEHTEVHDGQGRLREVLAWQSLPEATLLCEPDGTLKLSEISIEAWEAIRLPRVWDDPEKQTDDHPEQQLLDLFGRVKASLMAWSQSLDHLNRKAST